MAQDKKASYRAGRNEVLDALDSIRDKYSKLPVADIEKFAPVYYPIAIVEMNLDEMTFEDFESVQFAVLNLLSLGITDYKVVAETLGLSPNYVYKIFRLLNGYGHMDDKGITSLGRESIATGKKIVKSQVWQKFQIDALNGTLLKVEQTIAENMLNHREETNVTIGHLNYLEGISTEGISMQLKGNYSDFMKQKAGILNTNVISVNDARCTEVKYAKCYMMKLRNCEEPIVFAKRYDSNKKEVKERFSWQPFSVSNRNLVARYGFEPELTESTETARNYVLQLYELLLEKEKRIELSEEMQKALMWVHPFAEEGLYVVPVEGLTVPVVNINEKALVKYRSWMLNLLLGIRRDGEYLITTEKLYGYVISLRTESYKVLELARLLADKVEVYGKLEIIKRLRNKFRDFDGEELLVDALEKELKNM